MNKDAMGSFIAQIRKEKGLTQKDLAEKLCVTDKAVSKWERGSSFPDISMLEPLSEALDVSILELIEGQRITEEKIITQEMAQEIVSQSLSMSDDEIKRKHFISKSTIIIITVLLLLLASITLNIFNYQRDGAVKNLSTDSNAYDTKVDSDGNETFVDEEKALKQLLIDLGKEEDK